MFFNDILEAPADPIFGMLGSFQADVRPNKINLMVGIFKDEKLQNELLPIVRKAKAEIRDDLADYLPIDGLPEFGQEVGALAFGKENWDSCHSRIYAAQAPGGTGALRVGAEFLVQEIGKKIFLPQPTWANHRNIFERAGCQVESIPYYNQNSHGFDRDAFCSALERMEPRSIVVFHACCHNPTGSDPSLDEWVQISDLCKKRSLLPFFDFAYQGFGEGIAEDSKAVQLFLERGHDFLLAYSASKNFSLYCQRVGALFAVSSNAAVKLRVATQIRRIIRGMYSNPPAHGARIVLHILKNRDLRTQWHDQVDHMRHRISQIREALVQKLVGRSKNTDFSFLRQHKGMFSYLDLTKDQVQRLIDRFAIYTLDHGRINMAGISYDNIDAVADGIISVCE